MMTTASLARGVIRRSSAGWTSTHAASSCSIHRTANGSGGVRHIHASNSPSPLLFAATATASATYSSAHTLSPAVAFLLRSSNYDPASVGPGTGPKGRLLKGDILRAIKEGRIKKLQGSGEMGSAAQRQAQQQQSSTAASGFSPTGRRERSHTDIPLTQVRRVIASRLTQSKQTIPHAYSSIEIRMDELLKLRGEWKSSGMSPLPSVNDFIIRACGLALRMVPEANAIVDPKTHEARMSNSVDISVAVATPTGLITPIVPTADRKRLAAISTTMRDLAKRAKENKLKPEEFQGGSFTISNLGMLGIREFSAIINPPQACILAVGNSVQRIDDSKVDAFATLNLLQQQKKKQKQAAAPVKPDINKLPFAMSKAFSSSTSASSTAATASSSSSSSSSSPPTPSTAVRVPFSTYMSVTLVSDERAVDGSTASRFLTALKSLMEQPQLMQ